MKLLSALEAENVVGSGTEYEPVRDHWDPVYGCVTITKVHKFDTDKRGNWKNHTVQMSSRPNGKPYYQCNQTY